MKGGGGRISVGLSALLCDRGEDGRRGEGEREQKGVVVNEGERGMRGKRKAGRRATYKKTGSLIGVGGRRRGIDRCVRIDGRVRFSRSG